MGRCRDEYWCVLDSDSAPNPLLFMYSVCGKVKIMSGSSLPEASLSLFLSYFKQNVLTSTNEDAW